MTKHDATARIVGVAAVTLLVLCLSATHASAQVLTDEIGALENEIVASGSLGTSFASESDDESVSLSGSVSWLWSSVVGGEFLAGFAPNFSRSGGLDDLNVNNYMFNAIAAAPIGEDRRWQPFISGGVGALTLDTGEDIEAELDIDNVSETDLGGNIGFGVMRFADRWGFRADVRYFSQMGDPDPDAVSAFLDDLSFWRGSVGVAYRW
jgi:hypothetical protein